MNKRKVRTKGEILWDKRIGAALAFIRTRDHGKSQAEFAKELEISRGQLANIESGRTPLSALIGWEFCARFNCHPTWIVYAGKTRHINVFPALTVITIAHIGKLMSESWGAPFREVWRPLAAILDIPDEAYGVSDNLSDQHGKDNLDTKPPSTTLSTVRTEKSTVPTWPELKETIKQLTSKRGEKKALADKIGVTRHVLGNWLLGEKQGSPTPDLTLKLLSWVVSKKGK